MHGLKPSFHTCNHCFRVLRRHFTTQRPTSALHLAPYAPTGHALLTTRRLIAVSGHDASHFLHGLTTANIPPSSSSRAGFYGAFLNPTGRVLHDVFIYLTVHSPRYREWLSGSSEGADDPGFLIEVDANEVRALAAHLKKYKLRARVRIRVVEYGEWEVWSAWRGDDGIRAEPGHSLSAPPPVDEVAEEEKDADVSMEIGCVDRRAPGMGYRVILPGSTAKETDKASHRLRTAGEQVSVQSYEVHRMLLGVAEGQAEIVRETALPLESNMDYMGGIDFRKGCYVGQELTIRTRHTGVVRKRILPVMLDSRSNSSGVPSPLPTRLEYKSAGDTGVLSPSIPAPLQLPPRGTNITPANGRGRSAGKWLGGIGNIGLALCRLEVMTPAGPAQNELKIVWGSEEGAAGKGRGGELGERRGGEGAEMEQKGLESNEDDQKGSKDGMSKSNEVRVTAFIPSWHKDREQERSSK